MNKEILLTVDLMANERNLAKEIIFQAIEEALASVAARRYQDPEVQARVVIDRESGDFETFRCWSVVADEAEIAHPAFELPLTRARQLTAEAEVGDALQEPIESVDFGRIAAQQAKQVILQHVREAERHKVADMYRKRLGELLTGTVTRVMREGLTLNVGDNVEAFLPREQMIPREIFRLNDRVRVYLQSVMPERRGPQLIVSRTAPGFMAQLFRIEVPEIGEEVIEIKAVARDPGSRAKIAVKTNDGRMDPIGACVGMRGSRVQAVSNELHGERVDIVLWDDNPAQLVINAMSPAEVVSIVVDEDTHTMDIAVKEAQLSQAIGRGGQNVRLASELSGWNLNVMSETDMSSKQAGESARTNQLLMEKLGLDEDVAGALTQEGFATLEAIAYVAAEELQSVGFDAEAVAELQRRASDALLAQALETPMSDDDLMQVVGMTDALKQVLVAAGISSRETLAEYAVEELLEVVPSLNQADAAELIMAARAHWFE